MFPVLVRSVHSNTSQKIKTILTKRSIYSCHKLVIKCLNFWRQIISIQVGRAEKTLKIICWKNIESKQKKVTTQYSLTIGSIERIGFKNQVTNNKPRCQFQIYLEGPQLHWLKERTLCNVLKIVL